MINQVAYWICTLIVCIIAFLSIKDFIKVKRDIKEARKSLAMLNSYTKEVLKR